MAVRSLPVRNHSAVLVNLLVLTCGCSSCSPGTPCQQQRRPRSEGAASSSTRPSSSSGMTGSLHLARTQRLSDVSDKRTEAAIGSYTHLEPAPSQCRWAGAACKHRSASRCLGGRTASGSYGQNATTRHSDADGRHRVLVRKAIDGVTKLTSLQTGTGFSALEANLLCRF